MKVTLFIALLAVTLLLFITPVSYAETFRWIDESGKIRIGIKPSAKPENTKKDNNKNNTEIKKAPPVIANPVPAKTRVEHTTPSTQAVDAPQTTTPPKRLAPTPIVTTPEIIAPTKAPVSVQPPKPVQKNSVKRPQPVKQKTSVKQPAVKKAVTGKKPKKVISVNKKTPEKRSTSERNEELCDVFTGYVNDYKEKVRDCSKNLCDIYKRALARYEKKQKSYCNVN